MSIVSDGLIAHFDPDDTASYPGSGTTLTSLVGSVTASIVGSGGSFSKVTGGIQLNNSHIADGDYVITGKNILTSSLTNIRTISIWYKHNSITAIDWYLIDGRGSNTNNIIPDGSWFIANRGTGDIWKNSAGGIMYKNGGSSVTTGDAYSPPADVELGIWKNITIIAGQSFTNDLKIFGSFNDLVCADVTFGPIMIYNRAITQKENLTNYNVICSRYGLSVINNLPYNDLSPNANNLEYLGGSITTVGGRTGYNSVGTGSGTTLRIIKNFGSMNSMTYMCWIYPVQNDSSYAGLIFTREGQTIASQGIFINGLQIHHCWGTTNYWEQSINNISLNLNNWNHIAVTFSPTQSQWYLNGVLSQTLTQTYTSEAFNNF